jgi:hypothetical protein
LLSLEASFGRWVQITDPVEAAHNRDQSEGHDRAGERIGNGGDDRRHQNQMAQAPAVKDAGLADITDADREPAGAGDTPWGVNTACLYARNGERFLEMAIVRILENCRNEYYGSSCLNITGPGLFGKMLALYAREEDGFVGDYLQLTPCHPRKNMAFVLPDGRILAFGKVTAGSTQSTGLEAFGAAGTNSYPHMWGAGEVYAGGILRPLAEQLVVTQ